MPDLLGYWLTGVRAAEQTIASTTGLLDARTGDWAAEVVEALGLPTGLLPDVVLPGRVLAGVTEPVRAELGLDHELPVSAVGSHDTASAVVGVPAGTTRFGYVSCGTWALVGVELDAPVVTEAGRRANFTNERGVDGTIRYLRNVMGLWLLSESLRTWNLRGRAVELGDVLARPRCRRAARASTRTTRRSCRPATCRRGSPWPRSAASRTVPTWSSAASSTASRSRSPPRSTTPSGCPDSR